MRQRHQPRPRRISRHIQELLKPRNPPAWIIRPEPVALLNELPLIDQAADRLQRVRRTDVAAHMLRPRVPSPIIGVTEMPCLRRPDEIAATRTPDTTRQHQRDELRPKPLMRATITPLRRRPCLLR